MAGGYDHSRRRAVSSMVDCATLGVAGEVFVAPSPAALVVVAGVVEDGSGVAMIRLMSPPTGKLNVCKVAKWTRAAPQHNTPQRCFALPFVAYRDESMTVRTKRT